MRYPIRLGFLPAALYAAAAVYGAAAVASDVPYVPTPQPVVDKMLELGKVNKDSMVYDLGSGDGRIVITAAKKYGARGLGVDIDPERIKESRDNAKRAGVEDKVKFIEGNLFTVDLRPATVVTLYLLPEVNLKLRPKLLKELRPGTPIVSHSFDMGDWQPERTVTVEGSTIYLWHVPARVSGRFEYRLTTAAGRSEQHRLELMQYAVNKVRGTLIIDGQPFAFEDGQVSVDQITFAIERRVGDGALIERYQGRVVDNQLAGVALVEQRVAARQRLAVDRH